VTAPPGRLGTRGWTTTALPAAEDVLRELVDPAALREAGRLTADEVAWGWPYGEDAALGGPLGPASEVPHPRAVLEAMLLDALAAGPVVVTFSGGRDSSALLALALHVARREGLPDPSALTFRYPGSDVGKQEWSWQDAVAEHVGLSRWDRRLVRDDFDLLGPLGEALLDEVGHVTFPASLASGAHTCAAARGGTIVTGSMGDWAFGPRRMTVLRTLARGRGWRRPSSRRHALEVVAPRALRRRMAAGSLADLGWLQPAGRESLRRRLIAAPLPPLRWDRDLLTLHRQRFAVLARQSQRAFTDAFGVASLDPFGDPRFLESLAAWGGALGVASRNVAMRALFADVLPAALLGRTSKAYVAASRFGPATRAFAAGWHGSGVDTSLVDPEALRAEWSSPTPHVGTLGLLQQAWLARR
jgi:asparagine synthase (glutamine-hydrolysing)